MEQFLNWKAWLSTKNGDREYKKKIPYHVGEFQITKSLIWEQT